MSHSKSPTGTCQVCGNTFPSRELIAEPLIRTNILNTIRADHPDWSPTSRICQKDLARYRGQYVHSLLVSEKGELSELEHEVLNSLQTHQTLAADIDSDYEEQWNLGQRLADRIATFGGSWTFLICFSVFIVIWIMMNSLVLYWRPVDPFPFILLNLLLSCLAAIQAPVIMMSQNRQEAKDRLRARNDYQVNLKAELEIRQLHEKIDHLLSHQWERMIEIQEVQLDLLNELRRPR
ncbi:MAG: hypothetical protein FD131_2851 [Rhodocyclaceae bacterium]|nr:MAG: hypothetical protein FD131_2851 [Rhodocyclaceae bacterium]